MKLIDLIASGDLVDIIDNKLEATGFYDWLEDTYARLEAFIEKLDKKCSAWYHKMLDGLDAIVYLMRAKHSKGCIKQKLSEIFYIKKH